jgi:hypothetical protein
MFDIFIQIGNANQNDTETPFHCCQNGYHESTNNKWGAGGIFAHLYTVTSNVN